jgi:hypothetical protein
LCKDSVSTCGSTRGWYAGRQGLILNDNKRIRYSVRNGRLFTPLDSLPGAELATSAIFSYLGLLYPQLHNGTAICMSKTNRQGLLRYIPDAVKRQVRQRCGFGCILCGNAIVQYEHVGPTFADASKHEADGITLLGPTHHAEVTSGMRSKRSVIAASANPKCLQRGFSSFLFEKSNQFPEIY